MPTLSFISDDDLFNAVRDLITVAQKARIKADKDFGRNVIDPFAALFEMAGFEFDEGTWKTGEMARQAQKTLQNSVGDFHQQILGSAKGWSNHEVGKIIDIASDEHKIIAEIKNKHNTLSGGRLASLYQDLDGLVMPKNSRYKGYTAYYVQIIPKRPGRFDKVFVPSDKTRGEQCAKNELIRQIDGASFYAKVTQVDDALWQLFNVLPSVIEAICADKNKYKFADRKFAENFFRSAFQE